MLAVMAEDSRYEEILLNGKEGVRTMCDVAQRLEEKGKALGLEQGIEQGKALGLEQGKALSIYELVSSGDITPECGARKLSISIEQLKADMEQKGYAMPDQGN